MQSLRDGYRAAVIGATGGIGAAIAAALKADPRCGALAELSRSGDSPVDLLSEASIAAAAEALATAHGGLDFIFDATGALTIDGVGPEKSLRAIDPASMAASFAVNAIGPALLIKHFSNLMPREGKSVFATLSARVGSIGDNRIGGWISYRSSKAALNQIVRTASREIVRRRPDAICVALHPGTVATDLSAPFAGSRDVFTPQESAEKLIAVCDGLTPGDAGGFFAYDGSEIDW